MIGIALAIALGVPALAALILWAIDLAYTARTGKPTSERLREKAERAKAPITKAKYFATSFILIAILALYLAIAIFSKDYRGWRIAIPLTYAFLISTAFYKIQVKWKRQGTATHQ